MNIGLTANLPEPNSGPTYGETNAFWEIKLESDPMGVAKAAMSKATDLPLILGTDIL